VEDVVEDEPVAEPVEDGTVTADAAPLNPPWTILGATVPLASSAAWANMSTFFDPSELPLVSLRSSWLKRKATYGGLMTPTIPASQWPGYPQ